MMTRLRRKESHHPQPLHQYQPLDGQTDRTKASQDLMNDTTLGTRTIGIGKQEER
jgi:hypothetical protein